MFVLASFSFLQVCPLIIKLLSDRSAGGPAARPFPILLRLLRLVMVIIRHYHLELAPDCEIFMAMLMRMLESDSSIAYRALA